GGLAHVTGPRLRELRAEMAVTGEGGQIRWVARSLRAPNACVCQQRRVAPLAFAALALAPGPRRRGQGVALRARQLAGGHHERLPPFRLQPVEPVAIRGPLL